MRNKAWRLLLRMIEDTARAAADPDYGELLAPTGFTKDEFLNGEMARLNGAIQFAYDLGLLEEKQRVELRRRHKAIPLPYQG